MAAIARFSLIALVIFVVFPFALGTANINDNDLEENLGIMGKILKPFIPKENIPTKTIQVGSFETAIYLETSILEPVSTQVITSKGTFVVRGNVSALKGQDVTLKGLDDDRLTPELCISTKCYSLIAKPEL